MVGTASDRSPVWTGPVTGELWPLGSWMGRERGFFFVAAIRADESLVGAARNTALPGLGFAEG